MTSPAGGPISSRGVVARYFDQLPVSEATPIVSLGEGDTPLIHSERLSDKLGVELWLKCEGLNPTGSFKDRGMALAVSKALEAGARAIACASTGNTSASAAAYAGRAGLTCAVVIPSGAVALGKLAQAMMHGARVVAIDGNFDDALTLTKEIAQQLPVTLVNSVNPFRIEGQKTGAFEVVQGLGRAPQIHVMPVGNAGNITAYWRGYRESIDAGWATTLPRMCGFQAEGAAPIVRGRVVPNPQTVATAIRIGNPASWVDAVDAATSSGGFIGAVTDDEILTAYRLLAEEGVFVEPASAAGVAGLLKQHAAGELEPGSLVVAVLTGHGLKDPEVALAQHDQPPLVAPEMSSIVAALGLG